MSGRDQLLKYFILEEGVVMTVLVDDLRNLVIEIKISEWNLTSLFFQEFALPTSHDMARAELERILPNRTLRLEFNGMVFFELSRDPTLVFDDVSQAHPIEEGRRTIFGTKWLEKSPLLDRLRCSPDQYAHLTMNLVDAHLDVVFQSLTLANFKPLQGSSS